MFQKQPKKFLIISGFSILGALICSPINILFNFSLNNTYLYYAITQLFVVMSIYLSFTYLLKLNNVSLKSLKIQLVYLIQISIIASISAIVAAYLAFNISFNFLHQIFTIFFPEIFRGLQSVTEIGKEVLPINVFHDFLLKTTGHIIILSAYIFTLTFIYEIKRSWYIIIIGSIILSQIDAWNLTIQVKLILLGGIVGVATAYFNPDRSNTSTSVRDTA